MNFIPVTDVKMNDPLWSGRYQLVRDVVLPYMWEILNDRVEGAEKSHCVENFKIAAGQSKSDFYGAVFVDTDLYKWIEAVAYCLADEKNEALESLCDEAVLLIESAQQPDGYLNTYFTIHEPEKRWTNLMEGHELYCAGHLIEAAVAYFQATGKDKLLNVAKRFADLIGETFGEGKKQGYPGHPEIELALVRLYQETGEESYLKLARYFINERGNGIYIFDEECKKTGHKFIFPEMAHFRPDYFQAHLPVRDQKQASGHAVRAMYLYSAMADLARLTGDSELKQACETLYEDTVRRQMYVTGAVGAAHLGERFTSDYDLPSDSAYAETCASIGLMLFSSRMWLLDQKKENYDIWEQALFNTVLSAIGQDGKHFFYVNPLEVVPDTIAKNPTLSHVKTQRQKWFGVACCPPNLARILSSMRGYIYAMDNDRLFILSHIGSSFQKGGLYVNLVRQGDEYTLTIDGNQIDILLRLPENSTLVSEQYQINSEGYFIIHHAGGKMQYRYTLKPGIRVLRAHPKVSALSGKVCLQRGLITYCLEGADNSVPLSALRLPKDAKIFEAGADWLEKDMPILKASGFSVSEETWEKSLYNSRACVYESKELTFIPYSQWGNRGENEMRIWVTEK
jgi:DUF1680 family protein